MKEEGIIKEAKYDQDQKSEGAENQKEVYKVEIKALGEGELGYDDGEVMVMLVRILMVLPCYFQMTEN